MLKDVDLSKMKGRIQFVEHFADFDVEISEVFPDLKVKIVEHFANTPGKWQIVSSSPDIKLKIVENFGDFKIQFTEYAHGIC
jgi:hypothetical protein